MPRLLLAGNADSEGQPLVTRDAQERRIQQHLGRVFGEPAGAARDDDIERFLAWVAGYSGEDWGLMMADMKAMHALMPGIFDILEVWELVSGLNLKTAKCEVVPLVEGRLDEFIMGGRATDMRVRTASRCLGIVLGPDAAATQWAAVADNILPRTSEVLATSWGLAGRLVLFRTHILSLLLDKAH